MVKSIIKEIFIMLLLCVAIVLVLGVIFYDSIPSNKAVPNKLTAYTTPEDVQSKIDKEVSELNKVEVSYEITDSDLSLYKQTHSYTAGKPDPFSLNTTNTSNSNGGTQTNGTVSDPNSTNTFFNNTGHK